MPDAAETMAEAGLEEPHAKAIAGVVRDGLATGSDVRRLEDKVGGCATKSHVAELRAEVAGIEARLTRHFYAALFAAVAVNAAMIAAVKVFGEPAPIRQPGRDT